MRKQYLRLSAYPCDKCAGPVIAGSLGVRENEISKETDIRQVGARCLSCGHGQDRATGPARARYLSPIEWEFVTAVDAGQIATDAGHTSIAYTEALNRAELTLTGKA
jgi:hypothetical protein